jgi:hypothetical protein
MSPVIFYTLVLGIVGVLQYFLVPLVINNGTGEPGGASLFFNLCLSKFGLTNVSWYFPIADSLPYYGARYGVTVW